MLYCNMQDEAVTVHEILSDWGKGVAKGAAAPLKMSEEFCF